MRLERVDIWECRLPLKRRFQTSSSARAAVTHVLVRVRVDGVEGWGECAAPVDPFYCEETSGTCWLMLTEHLVPMVLGQAWTSVDQFIQLYQRVKGHLFAKAGLEMAVAVSEAARRGVSLAEWLGGTRAEVESGVSLGIEPRIEGLFDQIDRHLEEGYRRIKLKIAPGHDVEVVRAVRARYPEVPLQVDANSAYTRDDLGVLQALDAFELLMIEQPLAHDDIVDHAWLQARLRTPICLDESLRSLRGVRQALDLEACRVVNIKVGRVGGLVAARAIHDLCQERGVRVWCGGMHEFGIGRAVNLALASLPGFSLPGDVSGSERYYEEDLVEPPIGAVRGVLKVPERPGLGVEPVVERIERCALRRWSSEG